MKKRAACFIIALLISVQAMASDLQLQSIGASMASNLYLSFLSIGVLADSFKKNLYEKEQILVFVNSVVAQSAVQKDFLQKMMEAGDIPQDEKEFVQKMIKCFQLIMDEGNCLMDYVKSEKNESLAVYDAKRKDAWNLISEIMGGTGK